MSEEKLSTFRNPWCYPVLGMDSQDAKSNKVDVSASGGDEDALSIGEDASEECALGVTAIGAPISVPIPATTAETDAVGDFGDTALDSRRIVCGGTIHSMFARLCKFVDGFRSDQANKLGEDAVHTTLAEGGPTDIATTSTVNPYTRTRSGCESPNLPMMEIQYCPKNIWGEGLKVNNTNIKTHLQNVLIEDAYSNCSNYSVDYPKTYYSDLKKEFNSKYHWFICGSNSYWTWM